MHFESGLPFGAPGLLFMLHLLWLPVHMQQNPDLGNWIPDRPSELSKPENLDDVGSLPPGQMLPRSQEFTENLDRLLPPEMSTVSPFFGAPHQDLFLRLLIRGKRKFKSSASGLRPPELKPESSDDVGSLTRGQLSPSSQEFTENLDRRLPPEMSAVSPSFGAPHQELFHKVFTRNKRKAPGHQSSERPMPPLRRPSLKQDKVSNAPPTIGKYLEQRIPKKNPGLILGTLHKLYQKLLTGQQEQDEEQSGNVIVRGKHEVQPTGHWAPETPVLPAKEHTVKQAQSVHSPPPGGKELAQSPAKEPVGPSGRPRKRLQRHESTHDMNDNLNVGLKPKFRTPDMNKAVPVNPYLVHPELSDLPAEPTNDMEPGPPQQEALAHTQEGSEETELDVADMQLTKLPEPTEVTEHSPFQLEVLLRSTVQRETPCQSPECPTEEEPFPVQQEDSSQPPESIEEVESSLPTMQEATPGQPVEIGLSTDQQEHPAELADFTEVVQLPSGQQEASAQPPEPLEEKEPPSNIQETPSETSEQFQAQHRNLTGVPKQADLEFTITPDLSAEVELVPTYYETPTQIPEPLRGVVSEYATGPEVKMSLASKKKFQHSNLPRVTVHLSNSELPLSPGIKVEVESSSIKQEPSTQPLEPPEKGIIQFPASHVDICELCICQGETLTCTGLPPEKKLQRVPSLKPTSHPHIFRVLNLQGNGISSIDENIWEDYPWIEKLDLSHNFLKELHKESFAGLLSLQYLDLSGNQIKYIERETFESLPFLQVVNLSHNLINEIRFGTFQAWHGMQFLYKIILSHNPLTTIEDSHLYKLPQLTDLDVGATQVSLTVIENALRMTLQLAKVVLPSRLACCLCQIKTTIEVVSETVTVQCDSECISKKTYCSEEASLMAPDITSFMKALQARKTTTSTQLSINSEKPSPHRSPISLPTDLLDFSNESSVVKTLHDLLAQFSDEDRDSTLIPFLKLLFASARLALKDSKSESASFALSPPLSSGDKTETELNHQLQYLTPNRGVEKLMMHVILILKTHCHEPQLHRSCANLLARIGFVLKLTSEEEQEKYLKKQLGQNADYIISELEPRKQDTGHGDTNKLILAKCVLVIGAVLITIVGLIKILSHIAAVPQDDIEKYTRCCFPCIRKGRTKREQREDFPEGWPRWLRVLHETRNTKRTENIAQSEESSSEEEVIFDREEYLAQKRRGYNPEAIEETVKESVAQEATG